MKLSEIVSMVLRESGEPMSAGQIWAVIEQRGLWQTDSTYPESIISATLSTELSSRGNAAAFHRVSRGLYQFRNPSRESGEIETLHADPEHEEQSGEDRTLTPFDPTEVRVETKQYTIDLIVKRIRALEILLNPDFQRQGGIWTDEAMSRLIESLLINIPLPAFYFDTANEDLWVVIDGLQRLTAIKRFIIDKDLRLKGLEFLTNLNGKTFDGLERRQQRRIEESQITVYSLVRGTAEEVKFTIFRRINTGGLPLTNQEIRHALNQGKSTVLLKELADYVSLLTAIDHSISDDRQERRELVLRFLAFRLIRPEQYPGNRDFDWFLNEIMKRINQLPDAEIEALRDEFDRAMERAFMLFKDEAFRKPREKNRKPINKPLFESLGGNLADLTDVEFVVLCDRAAQFRARLRDLMLNDEDFVNAITSGTSDLKRVMYRFAAIRTIIQEVIHAEPHQSA